MADTMLSEGKDADQYIKEQVTFQERAVTTEYTQHLHYMTLKIHVSISSALLKEEINNGCDVNPVGRIHKWSEMYRAYLQMPWTQIQIFRYSLREKLTICSPDG